VRFPHPHHPPSQTRGCWCRAAKLAASRCTRGCTGHCGTGCPGGGKTHAHEYPRTHTGASSLLGRAPRVAAAPTGGEGAWRRAQSCRARERARAKGGLPAHARLVRGWTNTSKEPASYLLLCNPQLLVAGRHRNQRVRVAPRGLDHVRDGVIAGRDLHRKVEVLGHAACPRQAGVHAQAASRLAFRHQRGGLRPYSVRARAGGRGGGAACSPTPTRSPYNPGTAHHSGWACVDGVGCGRARRVSATVSGWGEKGPPRGGSVRATPPARLRTSDAAQ
jgi:hypothetical protein